MKNIYLLLVAIFFNLLALSQVSFEEVLPLPTAIQHTTEFDAVRNSSVKFADVDNDNDLDVLISGETRYRPYLTQLYINDGNSNFSLSESNSFINVWKGALAFSDIDGDNDLDVLITGGGENGAVTKLYTNDGNGNYTEAVGSVFENFINSSISFGDIDNDQDVIISGNDAEGNRTTKLYTNDGNGIYSEITGTPFHGVMLGSVTFLDTDNDNDIDLLEIGLSLGEIVATLYTNDGNGNYTEVTGSAFEGVYNSSVDFADIDGDNDLDIIIIGKNESNERTSQLYLNDGIGNYTLSTNTSFIGLSNGAVKFFDIDNDNDQDLLFTGVDTSNYAVTKLYINDGLGNFEEEINTPFDDVQYSSIDCADFDNDNDNDVIITGDLNSGNQITKIYKNDALGNFSKLSYSLITGVSLNSVAFLDIDNDNDSDLLIIPIM